MGDGTTPRGDRAFTLRITFVCLIIGGAGALVIGVALYSLRQPLTTNSQGGIIWSLGAFMVPLAGIVSLAILVWSVFYLPITLARRRGVVLDPEIWPATGAIVVGILMVVMFVGAILFGVI